MASGPGEEIDAAHYDWNWNDASRHRLRLGSRRFAHARQHLSRRQPGPLRRHHRRQCLGPGSRHAARTWSTRPPAPAKSCASRHCSGRSQVRERFPRLQSAVARQQPRPHSPRPQDPHHRLSAAHRLRRQGRKDLPHLLRSPLRQGPAQGRPRRRRRPQRPRPHRQLSARRRRASRL